jgi:Anti-sigma-K factor rskA
VTDGQHIPQEDLALYAMQSLSAADAAMAHAHVAACEPCRHELAEINGDLAAIALSVEQVPIPVGARDRFLARLKAEEHNTGSAPVGSVQARPVQESPLHAGPVLVPTPARRSTVSTLLPWAAVAAMIAVAAYLGMQNRTLQQTLNTDRSQIATLAAQASRAQQVLDTLTAPEAQQATLTEGKSAAAPTAHASYVPSQGALVFVATHLRPVPASKTYELWVIPANGSAPIPAGTFRPDANGSASIVLPPLPKGVPAKVFGVTIENEGGATSPTMPIVLAGN